MKIYLESSGGFAGVANSNLFGHRCYSTRGKTEGARDYKSNKFF